MSQQPDPQPIVSDPPGENLTPYTSQLEQDMLKMQAQIQQLTIQLEMAQSKSLVTTIKTLDHYDQVISSIVNLAVYVMNHKEEIKKANMPNLNTPVEQPEQESQ